ncbi:MAG: hypothetical protein ACKVQJ_05550 [Pyrinomonadaceae bacterium]
MKEAKVKHTKFNLLVWRTLPKCKEMVKIITASMDEKLSWTEWILMKIHMLSCDPCVNFLKQIRFVRTVLRRSDQKLPEADTGTKLSDDARTRIKKALGDEHLA